MTTVAQEIGRQYRDQRATEFCAVAKWVSLGRGNFGNVLQAAKAGRAGERIIDGIKAAMSAGTTTDGSFAGPLAYQELADGFLVSLRNVGVFDAALPFAKDVPLNTQVALVTVGATAASVGEGQSKVISKLQLVASALTPRKVVAIVVASAELLQVGGDRASRLFQQELQRAVAAETDSKFLSVIVSGISPIMSSGSNAVGIANDFAALFSGLSLGSDSKVFIAMNPSDVKHVAVQITSTGERAFPTVGINGGDYCGATIITSDAVSGQMIAFDATQIAASGGTRIELDSTSQATIAMADAPDSPPSSSTVMTSLWQANLVGLQIVRYFGCERLRTGAVSIVGPLNYTSANSPA